MGGSVPVGDEPHARRDNSAAVNPLTNPLPWRYELYKRFKLIPWWFSYNLGFAEEAVLKDKIVKLGTEIGFQDAWLKKIVRHAVSEFSKKGLGPDYYGYHNIDHELEATYFTLLAAIGQKEKRLKQEDIKYLFVAALFHDYDPLKQFDKPHEDAVEWFVRNNEKIKHFIGAVKINLDLVLALIHRTAYPFSGKIAEHARQRMNELFTNAGVPEDDVQTRKHFEDLGWFLSVSERIAGYALGDFERAMDLSRRNAHALGWHPSVICEESVRYFSRFKEEKEMVEKVLEGVPEEYVKRFLNNAEAFREAWEEELAVRNAMRRKELKVVAVVENTVRLAEFVKRSVLDLYNSLPIPLRMAEPKFRSSLSSIDTILLTLRLDNGSGNIVGYAKGGPLEKYEHELRRGTFDENNGRDNTLYLEPIAIKAGYWGGAGGHYLRLRFLKEAKDMGYEYVTAYAHRNVIDQRMERGEGIEIVQKYDPDKLDYYRYNLKNFAWIDFYPYESTFQEMLSIPTSQ